LMNLSVRLINTILIMCLQFFCDIVLSSVNFMIWSIFSVCSFFWPCVSAKLSYFRDLKLGASIAARGENHDFLNGGGERNDYDWYVHLTAHVSFVCSMIDTYCTLFCFNK
jgi:hypothetical protein